MKIRNLLKRNIKIIISFVLGMIIAGSGVYAASVASSDVSYTNNYQSTVQGALDNLYSLSNGISNYKCCYSKDTDCTNYCAASCATASNYTQCQGSCNGACKNAMISNELGRTQIFEKCLVHPSYFNC